MTEDHLFCPRCGSNSLRLLWSLNIDHYYCISCQKKFWMDEFGTLMAAPVETL